MNYYNEFDPFAAQWLRNLIAEGLIPDGDVDERSITEVDPLDLVGYDQHHFFAGIGGWSLALRSAGWPDDREIWTGSCPCQPFSVAGKGAGTDDPRHLWPDFFRLIRSCRPALVMGEQTSGAAGYGWLDGVRADLATEGYASRGVDIPACAVDAPHIRQRLYWIAVADAGGEPRQQVGRGASGDEAADGREGWDRSQPDGDHRHCGDDESRGRLAHAGSGGPGRRALEPAGHVGHGDATGRDQGAGGLAGGDEGDLADAQRAGPPTHRRDAGEICGLSEAQRRAEHDTVVPGREHGAAVDGLPAPGADAPGDLALTECSGRQGRHTAHRVGARPGSTDAPDRGHGSFWSRHAWIECHDGKARRIPEPGFPLLASGVPNRVGQWRGFGNAIVPPLAAEVIAAWMEVSRA